MKAYLALFLVIAWLLAACTPTAVVPDLSSTEEPTSTVPATPSAVMPTAAALLPSPTAAGSTTAYTDPHGQFRLTLPAGWQPDEEQGLFRSPGGVLRVGYMPEMAFMNSANRVCERLANTPVGPARKIDLSPLPSADACTLTPLPEMSTDRVTLVVANPAGEPEQRYIFLESDQANLTEISASLELLNTPAVQEAFPYPTGAMRPHDDVFWTGTVNQPDELTLEEHAVVEASLDSPTHFEFLERIPSDVFEKRAEWREGSTERRLMSNNALLEPFGYSLEGVQGGEVELYALYHGGERLQGERLQEELVQDEISMFWPASVSASGEDFALVVEILNNGYRLVRQERIEEWDISASLFIPPVFFGDELLHVVWDYERGQVQVMQGEEQVYAFAALFLVDMPVKGLWSWEGHWLLEVDGFLIQDGVILNEGLVYEEIFGWQLLNGKPFYYFRKGPRVGVSYDGSRLPVYYDEVIHYRCCEPAMFNNGGNEDIAWFYGLRDGTWYYVEIGRYEE